MPSTILFSNFNQLADYFYILWGRKSKSQHVTQFIRSGSCSPASCGHFSPGHIAGCLCYSQGAFSLKGSLSVRKGKTVCFICWYNSFLLFRVWRCSGLHSGCHWLESSGVGKSVGNWVPSHVLLLCIDAQSVFTYPSVQYPRSPTYRCDKEHSHRASPPGTSIVVRQNVRVWVNWKGSEWLCKYRAGDATGEK